MTAVLSRDFVWANEGLQEIDQVINIDITELSSGPVHVHFKILLYYVRVTRSLWS